MGDVQLKAALEGLLFACGDEGLEPAKLSEILELEKEVVMDLIDDLASDYKREGRGLQIVKLRGAYQMTTRPELAPYLTALSHSLESSTLSQAAMETLAIIAYKQPICRTDIEEIRGVKCERPLRTLNMKQLIKEMGRKNAPGRPILYGTTSDFLLSFGLDSIKDLPSMDEWPDAEEVGEEHLQLFTQLNFLQNKDNI